MSIAILSSGPGEVHQKSAGSQRINVKTCLLTLVSLNLLGSTAAGATCLLVFEETLVQPSDEADEPPRTAGLSRPKTK